MRLLLLLVVAVLLPLANAANAATWNFTYSFGSNSVSGRISGLLQSDGNTILVDGVDQTAFNGVEKTGFPVLTTVSTLASLPTLPRVTLDGTFQDLAVLSLPLFGSSDDGFYFDNGVLAGLIPGNTLPTFATGPSFGSVTLVYDPAGWSITAAAIPEPANWAMLIIGFGFVGAARRRQQALALRC